MSLPPAQGFRSCPTGRKNQRSVGPGARIEPRPASPTGEPRAPIYGWVPFEVGPAAMSGWPFCTVASSSARLGTSLGSGWSIGVVAGATTGWAGCSCTRKRVHEKTVGRRLSPGA